MLDWKKDVVEEMAEEIESALYDIDIIDDYAEANEDLNDYAKIYAMEQLDDVLDDYCPSDILNMPNGKFEPSDYYFMLVNRDWGDELVSGCDLVELWEEYSGQKLTDVAKWLLTNYDTAELNRFDDEYKKVLAHIIRLNADNPTILHHFFFYAFENGILELNQEEGSLEALEKEYNEKYTEDEKEDLINDNLDEFTDDIVDNLEAEEINELVAELMK